MSAAVSTSKVQVIKSASDIASAVAHRLKSAGYRPVLLESAAPGATRRLMSFAGAVHAGTAELEGLTAQRCADVAEALALAGRAGVIPLLVADLDAPLPCATPPLVVSALVDARMRKRREPPVQIGEAPLVIGIGPGFRAGVHCHVVIESNWGEHLGAVLTEGAGEPYTGRHRIVEGLGRERYLYAPRAGTFHTAKDILAPVHAGEAVGRVDDAPLLAEAGGILRGLAWPGLAVEAGAKLAEIDPSGDPANCRGIHTRAARIAAGVLQAMERFHAAA
ncbi:MAG TPA: molybdenum hydroxylase [bacterium]|jgi:xanthine dehydrogenase accessory factor